MLGGAFDGVRNGRARSGSAAFKKASVGWGVRGASL
jgi:hypothetical protein